MIFPSLMAWATNKLITKSNLMRGDKPNRVPNRKIVGALFNQPAALSDKYFCFA